jgi:hypothetical protein
LQVKGSDGVWSSPRTQLFTKSTQSGASTSAIFFIDGNQHAIQTFANGTANASIDVSTLPQGLHTLSVVATSSSGTTAPAFTHCFMRSVTEDELSAVRLLYRLDEQEAQTTEGNADGNTFNFDISVANLDNGNHTITCQLIDKNGHTTPFRSFSFTKESTATALRVISLQPAGNAAAFELSGVRAISPGKRIMVQDGKKILQRR